MTSPRFDHVPARRRRLRGQWLTNLLYVRAVIWEFRWTLLLLTLLITVGTLVFALNPVDENGSKSPEFMRAFFGSLVARLAQPFFEPGRWYVAMIDSIFPVFGLVVVGEGIVRFGMLMFSRRH